MKKDIFAGISLGILIGGIIGLSIAEVTGIILGALTSILTAFFGLRPSKEGETGNKLIIGTFSLCCFIALLAGMYLRTNNTFSATMAEEANEYKAAGFNSEEIKDILLAKHFGLVSGNYEFIAEAKTQAQQTVLMADQQDLYLCEANLEEASLEEIQEAYVNSGGKYQVIQQTVSQIVSDPNELRLTLLFLRRSICDQK